MLYQIPNLLTEAQVAECVKILESVNWIDGRATAGGQAAKVKHNTQVPKNNPTVVPIRKMIVEAAQKNIMFTSAAFPLKILPPMFNRYIEDDEYGPHNDSALMAAIDGRQIRTDLAATIFLSSPNDYDGGGLVVTDTFGEHAVKLPAGHMVLYPASSVHHVRKVTRGTRLAAILWVQSKIRNNDDRAIMTELSAAMNGLTAAVPNHPGLIKLTSVFNNLMRRLIDT